MTPDPNWLLSTLTELTELELRIAVQRHRLPGDADVRTLQHEISCTRLHSRRS